MRFEFVGRDAPPDKLSIGGQQVAVNDGQCDVPDEFERDMHWHGFKKIASRPRLDLDRPRQSAATERPRADPAPGERPQK